ncbi:hypothetical protein [Armatimonas sp.]|uniref:O-antigen ligase family protein n=1 Tax=Armatimonas sp. TaxID=1872638 RepID=UPI00286A4E5E|nr:hypothetical protein [Armatimonas sp.]
MKNIFIKINNFIKLFLIDRNSSSILLLYILAPILMGSFTDLARAGDAFSLPIHYVITIFVAIIIYISLQFSITIGVIGMFIYLIFLGWLRRLLIPTTGFISNDPITLVSLIVSGVSFIRMLTQRKIPRFTIVSKYINILSMIMFAEVLNPFQGGIAVGFGGIIFRLVPIFWYLIGLSYGNRDVLSKIGVTVVICGVAQAFFGLNQTYYGFSEVEKFWIASGGGTQILGAVKNIGVLYRSVGTLLSFSEYVYVLLLSAAVSWCFVINKKYIYILPLTVIVASLVLSSSRGSIISLIVMFVTTMAVQGKNYRSWIPRLFLAVILAFWGLTFSIEKAKNIEKTDQTEAIIGHQIKGLSDPFGKESTGGGHVTLIVNAMLTGFTNPIGFGLGYGTLAGKLGEGSGGSETDYSDMFLALGFPGGILYIVICLRILINICKYWHDSRDFLALMSIAILIVCQGQWISGAHYSQSMILWFIVGGMDRIIWFYRKKEKEIFIHENK